MPFDPSVVAPVAAGAVALYALVRGSGVVVERSLGVAQAYGVPDAVVAVTVIATGTSLPEIGAHLVASAGILSGSLDYTVASATVLGGNLGSSTVQQTLLLGVFLVGAGRTTLSRAFVRSQYLPMLAAFVALLAVAVDGTVSRLDGLVLVGAFVAYAVVSLLRRGRAVDLPDGTATNVRRDAAVGAAALVVVLASAYVVVAAVETVVANLRLGGSTVGVVTLGVAAALPELSTVAGAVRRDAPNVALGTLVGSNVVNSLFAVGLGGLVSTYRVPRVVVLWDLPVKLLVGVGVWVAAARLRGGTLRREDGVWLVMAYFAYVSGRLVFFAGQ